jgi:hypothetical protein
MLPVFGLVLSICLLAPGSGVQAQEKSPSLRATPRPVKVQKVSSGAPNLLELFFFFRHLTSLDAAADKAVAEGNPDASEWKSLIQREAGLTEEQGSILKKVAYACNQALSDAEAQAKLSSGDPTTGSIDQPPGRMEIVSAAVDELRSRLGEEDFQLLAAYVHARFGSEIEKVSSTPGGAPAKTLTGDPEPLVETLAVAAEINVSTSITKLPDHQVFAVCDTAMDSATAQYYPRTLTLCGVYGSDGSQLGIPCDTGSPGQCSGIVSGFPGSAYQVRGAHNLVLYQGQCQGSLGLVDPLHYCMSPLPSFSIQGTLHPQGDTACFPALPSNACGLAQTFGRMIAFAGLSPLDVTLSAGQQQRFNPNIPAVLSLSGPGKLEGTLYTAPATITSPQTATIKACDVDPKFQDDCSSATIHLEPLKVEVAPAGEEVLPGNKLNLQATVTPSAAGLTVQWTLEDPTQAASITPVAADSTKATFQAPGKDAISGTQEILVKACVKPNASTEFCGTAKVRVPKINIDFIVNPPTHTLTAGGTIQLTALVSGSNAPLELDWIPSPDIFDADLTVITPDTLVATYRASATENIPVFIQACLKKARDICSELYQLEIVNPLWIGSVTGNWNAGVLEAPFTITGSGFSAHPTVTFGGTQATVQSASDSQITGVVAIPVAMGGTSVRCEVRANHNNGDSSSASFPASGQTSPTIAPVSRLEVSPATAEVRAGGVQSFAAVCRTATGALCNSPETVRWTASAGTIDPTGPNVQYKAPASVASSTTATVKACWGTGTLCAPAASVTLLPPATATTVTVSPKTATVRGGRTQQFTATVANNTNTGVTWSLNPAVPEAGSVSQTGLYTAPATLGSVTAVTVTATSQADGTKKDTAAVTLVPPSPVFIGPPPIQTPVTCGQTLTITVNVSGGDPGTLRYAFFLRRVGVTAWTPALTTPAWQTGNSFSWTPACADAGSWEILVWVRDAYTLPNENSYGYAASYNPGNVKVVTPLSLTSTPSPASVYSGNTITWTATAGGGDPATTRYAIRRRRVGTTAWTPTTLAWQTGNILSWTPASTETDAWEISILVKDATTPATSGYAASANPGNVQAVTPLTVTGTASPAWSLSGNAITWTANTSGGTGTSVRYALFRRRAGTTAWTPSVNSPAWQTSNVMSWTPTSADAGTWEMYIWVKDSATPANMNTYGYAAGYNAGLVQVVAPMSVSGTGSPASAYYGTTLTWTANASGNTPATTKYAFFRRRAGTSAWTPDVTAPAWQTSNVMSWMPTSADIATWEIIIWVKDGNTPANMNTYGFAAYYNAGPVQVVTPPTLSGTSSPSSVPYGQTITWNTNANGGTGTGVRYAFFRRRVGDASWTPSVNSPAWQTSSSYSWTPASADVGTWETYVWMKDSATPANMNTYGYAAGYNSGPVQVVTPAPLTVSGTGSPSTSPYGTTIYWNATTSGGVPSTVRYALFRRLAGTANWIPDVTAPSWQSSNILRWTPSSADVGTWEIIIWVKDINTSPTQNTYGFAAYYNAQPVQVVSP